MFMQFDNKIVGACRQGLYHGCMDELIAAFTPDQGQRLTGVSRITMARWYKSGLLTPRYVDDGWLKVKYLLSFRDLVALRTLLALRVTYKVPMQRLRKVNEYLQAHYDEPWASLTLFVLNREVFFEDPTSGDRYSGLRPGQVAIPFPIAPVLQQAHAAVDAWTERQPEEIGTFETYKKRQYLAGVGIAAAVIEEFLAEDCTTEEILDSYPTLTKADVDAVRAQWMARVPTRTA